MSSMLNKDLSATSLQHRIANELRRRLPPGWSLEWLDQVFRPGSSGMRIDAALALTDPRGESATIVVETRVSPLQAQAVVQLRSRWRRLLRDSVRVRGADGYLGFMVISPFLGPAARERLAEAGISYADDT